jgi:hypothetical protein
MEAITFAQPSLTTAQMNRQDQIDLTVNQATAAIVCCYLEHMNALSNKETGPIAAAGSLFVTQTELVNLVNSVQASLRTIP